MHPVHAGRRETRGIAIAILQKSRLTPRPDRYTCCTVAPETLPATHAPETLITTYMHHAPGSCAQPSRRNAVGKLSFSIRGALPFEQQGKFDCDSLGEREGGAGGERRGNS